MFITKIIKLYYLNLMVWQVKLEESELRQSDIKRATMDFNKEILVGGVNPNTGTLMSEKILKYFEHCLKTKVSASEVYVLVWV